MHYVFWLHFWGCVKNRIHRKILKDYYALWLVFPDRGFRSTFIRQTQQKTLNWNQPKNCVASYPWWRCQVNIRCDRNTSHIIDYVLSIFIRNDIGVWRKTLWYSQIRCLSVRRSKFLGLFQYQDSFLHHVKLKATNIHKRTSLNKTKDPQQKSNYNMTVKRKNI